MKMAALILFLNGEDYGCYKYIETPPPKKKLMHNINDPHHPIGSQRNSSLKVRLMVTGGNIPQQDLFVCRVLLNKNKFIFRFFDNNVLIVGMSA